MADAGWECSRQRIPKIANPITMFLKGDDEQRSVYIIFVETEHGGRLIFMPQVINSAEMKNVIDAEDFQRRRFGT
jgi:hypothetical protein